MPELINRNDYRYRATALLDHNARGTRSRRLPSVGYRPGDGIHRETSFQFAYSWPK